MPATTTQNTTRPQQSGTPRPRSSGQETPRSGSRQTPSRGRYSSSNPPPSNHRRASVEHTRPQSTIKNPAQRNGLQVHYFPAKSAQDSDVTSVSSTPTAAKKEGRQPARSVRSDKSVRDESPTKGTSSSKGSNLKKDKVVAIKRAIEELNTHLNDNNRSAKLMQAYIEFDHWDSEGHNAELHYGAATVLSQAITKTKDDNETRMICAALEMVFRASPKHVHAAYHKMNASIVPWLLGVLKRGEEGKLKHADVSLLHITKIFFYWSRIPELRMPLARHPGMLEMLIRVSSVVSPEAKAARMRLIANLANSEENKIFFVETKGFLESVLRTAVMDTSEKGKEYASTTLMDLAACPDNQVLMANSDRVLATMVKLAVTESLQETREAAIAGLQNLAFCQSVRVRLVTFSDGVILDAMRKTLSSDLNDKARRRAAGALTNMACDDTAEDMGNHKGLLETLAVVSTKDENSEVQTRAALALTKVASGITSKMTCYKTLMDALVVASLSTAVTSISQVLRIKARDPENRESMVRHVGVLDTLSDICLSSDYMIKDRENAMRAIMHLTNEDKNRMVMCQKTVLDALLLGACTEGAKWNDFFESAVVALERLATEHGNRPVMARHPGLLVAVAKVTEREQKLEDAGTVAKYERLAKPLLMSLLLAL